MSSDVVQAGPSTPKTFDFTKRKKWADLLLTELADGVNLIFSASRTVLYCAPALTELAGWKDIDLFDHDFLDFVATTDDQAEFQASVEESIQQNSELHCFVRLKCSGDLPSSPESPKDMLFEIRGEAHSSNADGVFFFVTAKAYPSRNTEMHNTYLDLKTENEQLQRTRLEISNRLPKKSLPPPTIAPSQIYATSPIHGSSSVGALLGIDTPGSMVGGLSGFDALVGSPSDSTLYDGTNYPPSVQAPNAEEDEEGSKRKKLKKTTVGEQYVCITCGRTDSPEWRKGPLGPKTLCNACGLRWAKQTRGGGKVEDSSGDGIYDA
ncbi:white collar 2 type of transcription factor [Lyophyllum atratum]|nr:white collar 2 type of transcription factor [Lyophyllum atratum]